MTDMKTLDWEPQTLDEVHELIDITQRDMQRRAETSAEQPVLHVAVNPWTPWMYRTAGAALGVILAGMVTVALNPDLLGWVVATVITFALLFAWVLGGHEITGNRPKRYERAA